MEQQCRRPLTDRVGPDRESPSGAAELRSLCETLKQLETLKQSKTALLWLTSNLRCLAKIPAVPSGVV
ncbi:hypothetical protein ACRRTK_008947 [Alexandromys fortis]